jgi:hypothetical protein
VYIIWLLYIYWFSITLVYLCKTFIIGEIFIIFGIFICLYVLYFSICFIFLVLTPHPLVILSYGSMECILIYESIQTRVCVCVCMYIHIHAPIDVTECWFMVCSCGRNLRCTVPLILQRRNFMLTAIVVPTKCFENISCFTAFFYNNFVYTCRQTPHVCNHYANHYCNFSGTLH